MSEAGSASATLITNVHVFDGRHDALIENASVLVEGNVIKRVSTDAIDAPTATVIDGGGCVMTPGLIDCHVHLTWNLPNAEMFYRPHDYRTALTLVEAEATLRRGYTSVRDTAGEVLGVKRAIDEGHFAGPRIWSVGSGISMTAGHGDFRTSNTAPRSMGGPPWTDAEYSGMVVIADGVAEVTAAARMQLRKGAHALKMFTSGAVSGVYDPLDISEYSFEEIKAVADEAKRWNTYLAVHTYNDTATQQSLQAGAMSIEHAHLITEDTVKMIADRGAFLCTQTGLYLEDPPADWSDDQKAKQRAARDGLDTMFALAKQYHVKIATGTDLVGGPSKRKQVFELSNRLNWFTATEILKQATASNAELLSWSGPRNPYPGTLGVIEEGALADLLLVNGNPLEDLTPFNNPEENIALIMKDGEVYKNTVGAA